MSPFSLSLIDIDGQKMINFANHSQQFVEVIFTIDGAEVKNGRKFNLKVRGYAYPPKLEKPVKRMKNDKPLKFKSSGVIKAYIFAGEGEYKEADLDKPAFSRNKLVSSVKFKRTNNQPLEILEIKY
jgi:hypothetical protein